MENKKVSRAKLWLCIALVLCLISSIGACVTQTSFGDVKVEDLRVVVGDGTVINGQIFIPKKASAENKLPLVVVSHGSFNNFDMQDLNMIELSRRGFVVISTDAYRHGSSSTGVPDGFSGMWQIIDYACSSYKFIDTEKIGVSGHSMGGAIANGAAQHFFQQEALGLGENRVSAVLTVGYDPQYTPYEFEGVEEPVDPNIHWGVIAAKYDEWFFKGETGNPALYLESEAAKSFINQLEGVNLTGNVENGKIYRGEIGGKEVIRVIYQNTEIHPMNHFSTNSAGDAIEFFYEAFGVPSGFEKIPSTNQVWVIKELFNLVGLIGILLFLFPFASVIMGAVPFFSELRAETTPVRAPRLETAKSKVGYWLTYVINLVIPALLVMPIMNKLIGKEGFTPNSKNPVFGEGNTNELGAWTAAVAICLLVVFLISNAIFGKQEKGIPEHWGLKVNGRVLGKSFLLALLTVTVAYVILFFSDLVFNTDYRIWMIAMRVFTVDKIVFALVYAPAFILFYLVNSLLVNGGNRVEGMPDWLVTVISCISNIAGIATLIFIQYSGIIADGSFTYNSMRIVNLFPLLVLIPIGTIITRRFFRETGKIYLGSFIIGMLYCMMTVANTAVHASLFAFS